MNRTATARALAPRFRALRYLDLGGIGVRPGEETDLRGRWAPVVSAVEALNESGQRLLDYQARYGHSRLFPSRPFNDFFSEFYLPAALPDGHPVYDGVGRRDNHPEYEDPPGCPLYVAGHRVDFAKNVTVHDRKPFAWLRWPQKGWRAANEPAAQVARYMAEYGGEHPHPDLDRVISPWCELHGLFLPELLRIEATRPAPAALTSHGLVDETGAIT
jgi:hypothetical protein